MLLLTKIENKLVDEQEQVNIKTAVETIMSEFHEIFSSKNLHVHTQLADNEIRMSKVLVEILLNNLLTNAIRHNINNGEIYVSLNKNALIIQNTGKLQVLDQQMIFQRFYKSPESEGSGLGLTLARQICENYGFSLHYSYHQNLHTFTVSF